MKLTAEEIIAKLNFVLEGYLTREEVSEWAACWIEKITEQQHLSKSDYVLWDYLDYLFGMDLQNSPTSYLHNEEDIREWISIIEAAKN